MDGEVTGIYRQSAVGIERVDAAATRLKDTCQRAKRSAASVKADAEEETRKSSGLHAAVRK